MISARDGSCPGSSGGIDRLWLSTIRIYLIATAVAHMVWETIQLPLYTLWQTGTAGQIAFAVLHCTAGDVAIAAAALALALVVAGSSGWPARRFGAVLGCCVAFGAAYTIYSEYLNVAVRHVWAYSALMPVLPGLGTGLAPLVQWIVVPTAALIWVRDRATRVDVRPRVDVRQSATEASSGSVPASTGNDHRV